MAKKKSANRPSPQAKKARSSSRTGARSQEKSQARKPTGGAGSKTAGGKRAARGKGPAKRAGGGGPQRLNKILAGAGLGSRRDVEELIVQGRVEVDREIVTDLAFKADPGEVTIKVDGQTLKHKRLVYFALNKPKGVLSTNRDPSGRLRVVDLVPDKDRVFSVGRLDRNSEGLMLLTNDGELAQRLAHPKYRVQKSYFVVVSGLLSKEELEKLRRGVYLAEGVARIDGAKIKRQRKGCTEVEIVLSEGKNREIRRILARAGHKVVLLRRIAIGSLKLGQLPVGASRELSAAEVRGLYALADASAPAKKPKTSKKRSTKKPTASSPSDMDDVVAVPALNDEWDLPDDDFVGDFSFSESSTSGSVLAYDEEPEVSSSTKRRGAGESRGRKTASSGRRGTRQSSRSAGGKQVSRKKAQARATSPRKKASDKSPKVKTSTRSSRSTAPRKSSSRKAATGKPAARKGTAGRKTNRKRR